MRASSIDQFFTHTEWADKLWRPAEFIVIAVSGRVASAWTWPDRCGYVFRGPADGSPRSGEISGLRVGGEAPVETLLAGGELGLAFDRGDDDRPHREY